MVTEATFPQKCSSPCMHTLQQGTSAKGRTKYSITLPFKYLWTTIWPFPHHSGGLTVMQNRKSYKCTLGSAGQKFLGASYCDCRGTGEWRKQHGIWRNLCVWQLYFTAWSGCCWGHFLLSLQFSGNADFGMNWTLSREFSYLHSKKYHS